MGGSFLSLFSSIISNENKFLTRQYISYGYLSMGIVQLFVLLIFNFSTFDYFNIFYIFLGIMVYFPSQKIFELIKFDHYVKLIGFIALLFSLFLINSYYF